MLDYLTGDLFASDAGALVNAVDCADVKGPGVALQFKKSFPENYGAYARACEVGQVRPGRMFVFESVGTKTPKYIISFPTKRHWREKGRMAGIESGLIGLRDEIRAREIRSIAVPALGSWLRGLNWIDVKPRIESALQDLTEVQILIYEPIAADGPC